MSTQAILEPPATGAPINDQMLREVVDFFHALYGEEYIPLHRPVFEGNERRYLVECIDSNFVSSVGARVTEFERQIADFTGTRFAVATVNGTAALHVALGLVGVGRGDEVITQALTFVATCNAVSYAGAHPVFIDVDRDTMGMSPTALRNFIETQCRLDGGALFNRRTGRRIAACLPMHTFGQPARIEEIARLCEEYAIPLVEDAAESLGSRVRGRHTGTFGRVATLSFNGNKIITTGGGGMLVTDDEAIAVRAKHLTTTAKRPHSYEFFHDEIGFNYRMPNLNAALGCAQMERLAEFLTVKARIAAKQATFFSDRQICFAAPIDGTTSNHWLNAIIVNSLRERDRFLEYTNGAGVMTRPIWRLMTRLPMFADCQHDSLANSIWLEERVVNVPSSVTETMLDDFSVAGVA